VAVTPTVGHHDTWGDLAGDAQWISTNANATGAAAT
jgi:hypothetical protein